MITKQNAQALANTARECASLAGSVSGTIKSIVIHWNLCCQQSKMEGFTTEASYTRRAALAADFLRMAEQLDRLADNRHPITGQTADEAHAEALEMNTDFDEARYPAEHAQEQFKEIDPEVRGEVIAAAHAEALGMDKAFATESTLKKFASIAPYIISSVMARLTGEESEDATLAIIHEEIIHYFEAHQNMAMQYLAFNEDQRRAFAEVMYDIHQFKGEKSTAKLNPVYERFVKETGKSGALGFICHHLSRPDLNSFDIYQRADGIQLAVNADGKATFIRPFKSANWLIAGFEANLDYYWLVSKGENIGGTPNKTAFFNDGVLTVCEEA